MNTDTLTEEKLRDLRIITRHGLKPVAGAQLDDAAHWIEVAQKWTVTQPTGETHSLGGADLGRFTEDHVLVIGTWMWRNYLDRPRAAAPVVEEKPQGTPARPTPTEPKAKKDAAPDEPRRQYDDDTLAREVLDFLRANRRDEFTYNQVADEPSIWCEFKPASKALRSLKDRGPDVIEYKHATKKDKKGNPVKLWKYAPERKLLDHDYSRAEELVGGAILGLLGAKGPQSQNAICGAMRLYFGYVDKAMVKQALEGLRAAERLEESVGPRNAKVFSLRGLD